MAGLVTGVKRMAGLVTGCTSSWLGVKNGWVGNRLHVLMVRSKKNGWVGNRLHFLMVRSKFDTLKMFFPHQ